MATGDSYHDVRLYATSWTDAIVETKEKALIMATQLLCLKVQWPGSIVDQEQSLDWPRVGGKDDEGRLYDSNIVPLPVQHATADFARYLIESNRVAEQEVGLTRLKLAVLEMAFDKSDRAPVIPVVVLEILTGLGLASTHSVAGRLVR